MFYLSRETSSGETSIYSEDDNLGTWREFYFFLLKMVQFLVAKQCCINGYADLEVLQLSMERTEIYTFIPTGFSLSGGTGK